ncbi:MAG TPA: glycoside hydrolase family 30 beta sandwich domain-containing protein [Chitinivibrionales bacterium]|nr:glycoside hydrolase family 30 beta sandwich domain-containing protein [Chitinivibrionales bacterium]
MPIAKRFSRGAAVKWLLVILLAAGAVSPSHAVLRAKWRTSVANAPWAAEQQLPVVAHTTQATEIDVDTTVQFQTMTGWGGSPNESSVLALHKLPQALQDSVMRALFDTVSGCKFNMIRLPIGCSDFSLNGYSLDDSAGDDEMKYVNIHRDSLVTLDFVKKAVAVNPALKVWGSPWTAPAWMKANDNWSGGASYPSTACELHQDIATLTAYALYFSKVVTLFKNDGIPFFALAFQNEPYTCQPFPSMIWPDGATMLNFMKNYLGPRMKADHPDVELWTPTMNLNDSNYYIPMLRDSYCSSIITTVCYQYQGEQVINYIHKKFPNLREYGTELVCGGGDNQWNYPQSQTFPEIKLLVANGASGAFQWNLLLANGGWSAQWGTGAWQQNCMITIDTIGKKIVYNSQYYGLKHLSYYIRPGSKVLKVTGQYDTNEISVKNPDGSIAVVTNNQNNAPQNVAICVGSQMVTATLPALSFASFLIYDSTATGVNTAAVPDKPVPAPRTLKVNGDGFALPHEYAQTSNICAVYTLQGRLVREFSVRSGVVNLSKDYGMSRSIYIVRLRPDINRQ